jgi:hypothetical protein
VPRFPRQQWGRYTVRMPNKSSSRRFKVASLACSNQCMTCPMRMGVDSLHAWQHLPMHGLVCSGICSSRWASNARPIQGGDSWHHHRVCGRSAPAAMHLLVLCSPMLKAQPALPKVRSSAQLHGPFAHFWKQLAVRSAANSYLLSLVHASWSG